MRVYRSIERVTQQRAEVVRETVGIDALTLDETGIAERGLLRGSAAVEQDHGSPAALQVQRHADADNTGAEHDHIGTRRRRGTHQRVSREATAMAIGLVPG